MMWYTPPSEPHSPEYSATKQAVAFPVTDIAASSSAVIGADVGLSVGSDRTPPKSPASDAVDKVGDTVGEVGDAVGEVGDMVGDVGDEVGDAVVLGPVVIGGLVGASVGDAVGEVGDMVGDVGDAIGDTAVLGPVVIGGLVGASVGDALGHCNGASGESHVNEPGRWARQGV